MSETNTPRAPQSSHHCNDHYYFFHCFCHNIQEALELLEKYYQFLDHKQGDTRALAFGQASCTIKTLPKYVQNHAV